MVTNHTFRGRCDYPPRSPLHWWLYLQLLLLLLLLAPARYMLVYFGFTFCPDICPAELAKVTKMLKILGTTSRPKPPLLPRYPLPVLIFTSVHWTFLLWCQQRKRKGSHLVWLSPSSSPLIPTATPLARSGAI